MYKTLFNPIGDTNSQFTDEEFHEVIKAITVKEYLKKSAVRKQVGYVMG